MGRNTVCHGRKRSVGQAKYRTTGMSCFNESLGSLTALYYDPLGENILFPSFHVHEWLMVANRVKATNEKFVDQSEEYREGIHLQSF